MYIQLHITLKSVIEHKQCKVSLKTNYYMNLLPNGTLKIFILEHFAENKVEIDLTYS